MKLKNENEGVSPVVGVILMVAITVVLAAIVFVLVNNLGHGTNNANTPQMGFAQDNAAKSLTVNSSPLGVHWSDIGVTGCTTRPTTGDVLAGQKITGCTGEVLVTYTPTNAVILQTQF